MMYPPFNYYQPHQLPTSYDPYINIQPQPAWQEYQESDDRQPPQLRELERRVNQLNRQVNQLEEVTQRHTRQLNRLNQRVRNIERRLNIPFTASEGEF